MAHELEVDTTRWCLIVNPKAGGGRGLLDFLAISKLLHDNEIVCEAHFTEHKYQAVEYTVSAVNMGFRKIIVVGGDGTLHEVINGLYIQKAVSPREVTVAVIGVSVESDWSRTHGFKERSYVGMVEAIKAGHTIYQDVGIVSYEESHFPQTRYMVSAGGTGFDAEVVKRFAHSAMKRKRRRDRANIVSYLWCVTKTFFRFKHPGVKIYIDDYLVYNGLLFSAIVGIGKYNSGGFQLLPDAVVDDGMLDMTIIRPIHFWHILFRFLYLYDGNIYKIRHTERWRGRKIRIVSIPDMLLEVDGELLGGTPITFEVDSRAVKFISLLERS